MPETPVPNFVVVFMPTRVTQCISSKPSPLPFAEEGGSRCQITGVLLLGKGLCTKSTIYLMNFNDEFGNVQGENSECRGLLPSVAMGFHPLLLGK